MGKRACLWLQDFVLDLERLRFERGRLKLRGAKGTTGTQATFLDLFDGRSLFLDVLGRYDPGEDLVGILGHLLLDLRHLGLHGLLLYNLYHSLLLVMSLSL